MKRISFIALMLVFTVLLTAPFMACSKTPSEKPAAETPAADQTVKTTESKETAPQPDGEIVDGVRVIPFELKSQSFSLHVFRGETIKLVIPKQDTAFTVQAPDFEIDETSADGAVLELKIKVKQIGTYPIFYSGGSAGTEKRQAQLVVMQYRSESEAIYKELSAAEAKTFIEKNKPLILDVRTPGEYAAGRLEGAVLVPVFQLSARLGELEKYKEQPVFVYCRSGNRSTVAAQILIKKGYKKLYNLRPGIRGWMSSGYEIKKDKE